MARSFVSLLLACLQCQCKPESMHMGPLQMPELHTALDAKLELTGVNNSLAHILGRQLSGDAKSAQEVLGKEGEGVGGL